MIYSDVPSRECVGVMDNVHPGYLQGKERVKETEGEFNEEEWWRNNARKGENAALWQLVCNVCS
jgi:hypothetical protein